MVGVLGVSVLTEMTTKIVTDVVVKPGVVGVNTEV